MPCTRQLSSLGSSRQTKRQGKANAFPALFANGDKFPHDRATFRLRRRHAFGVVHVRSTLGSLLIPIQFRVSPGPTGLADTGGARDA